MAACSSDAVETRPACLNKMFFNLGDLFSLLVGSE